MVYDLKEKDFIPNTINHNTYTYTHINAEYEKSNNFTRLDFFVGSLFPYACTMDISIASEWVCVCVCLCVYACGVPIESTIWMAMAFWRSFTHCACVCVLYWNSFQFFIAFSAARCVLNARAYAVSLGRWSSSKSYKQYRMSARLAVCACMHVCVPVR